MTRLVQALIAIASVTLAASCSGSPGGPTINNKMNSNELAPAVSSVVSTDILAREPLAHTATRQAPGRGAAPQPRYGQAHPYQLARPRRFVRRPDRPARRQAQQGRRRGRG